MPKPLVVIPMYLTIEPDIEVTLEAVRSVRKTVSESVDILVVDDHSPDQSLVDMIAPGLDRLDAELHRKPENSGFCSPPDELVLTSKDGYVPLGQLDPDQHGLVSYVRSEDRIVGSRWSPGLKDGGYSFGIGKRPYSGTLLGVETESGLARVTPNHGITFRWTPQALSGWCVYIMRRGSDWRIGQTKMTHYNSCFGPWARKKNQGADAIWILSLHDTKADALAEEAALAWSYGVPSLQFKTMGKGIRQEQLDDIWRSLDTEPPALRVLSEFGRDTGYPFEAMVRGRANSVTTQAVNLMPGDMMVPTVASGFSHFMIDEEQYSGEVLSLDVPPHGHYVSNGVVVHNSKTVNIGLRRALEESRDAVLLNADVEMDTPGWVKTCQKTLDSKDRPAAVVGALLLYPNGLIQHAGIYFSMLTRGFDHMYKYGPGNLPEALVPSIKPVTGAFQYIRHEALELIGLYDENFHMAHEDVDFCIRIFLSGLQCVYQPKVRAYHFEMMFRGRPSPKVAEWQQKSWIYFAEKWATQSFGGLVPYL